MEALWWAWCPTVLIESGNGAHVDIVAAGLVATTAVLATTHRGRRAVGWSSGVLVGLAASVKLTPLVVVPALMPLPWGSSRRGPTRLPSLRTALAAPVAAVVTLALTYLPHLLVAGALVVGYLPGYLSEEGGANRAGVLGLLLPDAWLGVAMLTVMAVAAGWVAVRVGRGLDAAVAALVLLGTLLVTTTPSYPWYALPLVALAVLTRRLEWLAVAVAGYVAYAGTRGAAGLSLRVCRCRGGGARGRPPPRRPTAGRTSEPARHEGLLDDVVSLELDDVGASCRSAPPASIRGLCAVA